MTHVTITSPEELNDGLFSRGGITRIDMRSVRLEELPAEFGRLDELQMLEFHHCTLGGFHPDAFLAGATSRKVAVEFSYCEFDSDALFERALVHGLGTWRVQDYGSNYRRDPRWKRLASIGNDGVGDEAFRRAAYALAGKEGLGSRTPSDVELRLLNHSKKPLRERAALFLDERLPSPIAQGEVAPGTKVLVLGKPLRHDKASLGTRLEALGLTVTRTQKSAGAVLLLIKPGAKLAAALDAALPVLVEGHLESAADAAIPAAPVATAAEEESLDRLLFNEDAKNALLGLSLVKARALDGKLLADVVAVAFFSTDAAVRKEGRALLLAKAPETLRARLQGDKRNYAIITDGNKLTKLAKELAAFGLDPTDFSFAMLRVFAGRPNRYGGTFEPALQAALAFPGQEERVFELLADEPEIYLPVKKTFPKGLSKLRALKKLRVQTGVVKSDENLVELADLPQPFDLEYWSKDTKLEHLRCIANRIRGLFLRGAYSNVSNIEELARFDNLRALNIEHTGVEDLAPLSGLALVSLNLRATPVTTLEPLRGMTSLQGLFVSRFQGDLSPLADLVGLRQLDISFTACEELGVLRNMSQLNNLDLWGTSVVDLEPLVGKPLHTLSLNHMPVQPDLSALGDIPTLGSLNILGTAVDEAQLAALSTRLPQLHIWR